MDTLEWASFCLDRAGCFLGSTETGSHQTESNAIALRAIFSLSVISPYAVAALPVWRARSMNALKAAEGLRRLG